MIDKVEKLVQTLAKMEMTISTAESCTGGMLASKIVDVSGASDVFNEGFITYSNSAKSKYLNVSNEILDEYGAVSEQTVIEMAKGCKLVTTSDMSLVTSGIAGPGGGTPEKPVGLVYIACAYKDNIMAKSFRFDGDRHDVRCQAVEEAINMALNMLENH